MAGTRRVLDLRFLANWLPVALHICRNFSRGDRPRVALSIRSRRCGSWSRIAAQSLEDVEWIVASIQLAPYPPPVARQELPSSLHS